MLIGFFGLGVYIPVDAVLVVFGDFVIFTTVATSSGGSSGIRLDWDHIWPRDQQKR
jgi:hypothetical protein